jgi:hypothetical protein
MKKTTNKTTKTSNSQLIVRFNNLTFDIRFDGFNGSTYLFTSHN